MSSGEYQQALEYLYARTTGGVKLGLERTTAFLDALGNPHRAVPCFHVGGTNGKGSTVATMAALLRHRGLRVATYTSPHLVDFRERIVVDRAAITEEEVAGFVGRHRQLIDRLGVTFFEATTAMAFDYIARTRPDVAIIEVGLGGRLDSTNVVDPLAAVVTSIDLDHTEWLGSTLESIAAEKAGIYKLGRPAIVGHGFPRVTSVLRREALARGASPVVMFDEEIERRWVEEGPGWTEMEVGVRGRLVHAETGLVGDHQWTNTWAAWLALDAAGDDWAVPVEAITPALKGLQLPGRWHRVGNVVFDVAHNAAGIGRLVSTARTLALRRPLVGLLGVLGDKDWRDMIKCLGDLDELVLTMPPTAPADRRWDLDAAFEFARDFHARIPEGWESLPPRASPVRVRAIEDFDEALRLVTANDGTTIITGSFHTVGDAMSRLQVDPLVL